MAHWRASRLLAGVAVAVAAIVSAVLLAHPTAVEGPGRWSVAIPVGLAAAGFAAPAGLRRAVATGACLLLLVFALIASIGFLYIPAALLLGLAARSAKPEQRR